LQDDELRARHRYVDLIMNSASKSVFYLRSIILRELRNFFDHEGFLEVETPILHPQLGGAAAKPFITHHNTLDRDYFLRVATELPLKKIIVGGFGKVYELGRNFRNEGMDTMHNPEYTSLEAYQAYASYEDMMNIVEKVFRYLATKLGKMQINYKGVDLDFSKPFARIDMAKFVKQETNIDFDKIESDQEAIALAKKHNLELKPHMTKKGHILNLFFEQFCEEKCLQPTFVIGHPIEVSPLAKKDSKHPHKTERFELFICGKEYCNAFSELNDAIEQAQRFNNQLKERELGNYEANDMDHDFINALEYGMPPTGGLGLGVDRIVMLFTNQTSIKDVLFFPHMKD
jgi:lysyl-tRNA synthetase class 2